MHTSPWKRSLQRLVTKYLVRVSIFGPPPATNAKHAFRSVKARVTTSELGKEMCADENEDR